jgi:hypothetical protein
MRSVPLQQVRDLSELLAGRRLSSPAITHDGRAVFLAMPPGSAGVDTEHFGRVYPEEAQGQVYSCEVILCSRDEQIEVPLDDVDVWLPKIQRLGDQELLLVDLRGWRSEMRNAKVYDLQGRFVRSFHLTPTRDVFADAEGTIWASFDDESRSEPDGGSALVRLDADGNKLWGFEENRAGAGSVWVFYALNVSRGATWACGYTDFEIVRIKDGRVDSWKQPVGWVTEIAVDEPHVLMMRGGGLSDPTFTLGRFVAGEVEQVSEIWITLPDGPRLSTLRGLPADGSLREKAFTVVGREDALHVFGEDGWFRVTVADVLG